MEAIKQFTEQKIKEYVDILNIQMTKENTNEITYGDKFVALGGLNMAISIMKLINPTFEFDLIEEMGLTDAIKEKEMQRVIKYEWFINL
jgi:hypothetical protein